MNLPYERPTEHTLSQARRVLEERQLPDTMIASAINGAVYFSAAGGTQLSSYWRAGEWSNRDEFLLIVDLLFDFAHFASNHDPATERTDKFSSALLFHLKSHAQSAKSLDMLAVSHCYGDAFAVCRAMHSRLHLLLLWSLNPNLFNHWTKEPKNEMFLDGHVRRVLEANQIPTMSHLYELGSEIIHGQHLGYGSIGYMENGLFADVPAVRNQLYVAGKLIYAMLWYCGVAMYSLDYRTGEVPDSIRKHLEGYNVLTSDVLAPNRLDHLWTVIGEERHWIERGKGNFHIGGTFDPASYFEQLEKFHRTKGQRKRLPKKYDI